MEYYSGNPAICKNMDELEGIIQSDISQMDKDKYCMVLDVESKKLVLIETKSRMVVARGWGLGKIGRSWSKGSMF